MSIIYNEGFGGGRGALFLSSRARRKSFGIEAGPS